eukprot:2287262-Pyramimonas_sp.AAC.2
MGLGFGLGSGLKVLPRVYLYPDGRPPPCRVVGAAAYRPYLLPWPPPLTDVNSSYKYVSVYTRGPETGPDSLK